MGHSVIWCWRVVPFGVVCCVLSKQEILYPQEMEDARGEQARSLIQLPGTAHQLTHSPRSLALGRHSGDAMNLTLDFLDPALSVPIPICKAM